MNKKLFFIAIFCLLLSNLLNAEEKYTWGSLPLGGAGFVTGVVTCPQVKNLIFVRTDVGGAYRWVEETKSWKPITDFASADQTSYMGAESIAIDPQEPNKIYMYCGTNYWNSGRTAILYSEDYGDNFVEKAIVTSSFPAHGNDNGRQCGERLAVDPNKGDILLCGSRTRGLWKSVNGGANWTRLASGTFPNDRKVAFVQFIPASSTPGNATPEIYVGLQYKGGNNLFVSTDEGANWTAVAGQTTTHMTHRCLLSNGKLYITYTDTEGPGSDGTGSVKKYDLTSKTWTDISPGNHSFGEVSVDPTNPNNLMVSTQGKWMQQSWISGQSATWGDQVFLSTNDGTSWKNLFPSSVSFVEPTIEWVKKISQMHWTGSAKIDPFNKDRAFFISGNGVYMTENLWAAKPTFKMAVTGLEETVPLELVSLPGAPVVTAIGDYDGFVYHDIKKYYARHSPNIGTTSGVAVAGKNIKIMVRMNSWWDDTNKLDINNIYLSEDMGAKWTKLANPTSAGKDGWCAVGADGNCIVVTPLNARAFYTFNKGTNWTEMPSITTNGVRFFADFEKENVFYAVVSNNLRTYTYNETTKVFEYTAFALSGAYNNRLTVVPGIAGEIWVPRNNNGLRRIKNAHTGNPTNTDLAVSTVTCVGVGKAAPNKTYPSLYIWGRPKSADPIGLYRSDDEGVNWVRINDDAHQFGGPGNAQFVKGDMNVYGRVYMSTVGRGVIYGELEPLVILVASITLDKTSHTFTITSGTEATLQLTATILPSDATVQTVRWTSSDPTVATVSNEGLVTAIAKGTTVITVTTDDGEKTATCDITVDPGTGFDEIIAADPVICEKYYTLQGVEVQKPVVNGIYLVKKTYASKRVEVVKKVF